MAMAQNFCGPQCRARHSIHEVAMAYEATALGWFFEFWYGRWEMAGCKTCCLGFFDVFYRISMKLYQNMCHESWMVNQRRSQCLRPSWDPVGFLLGQRGPSLIHSVAIL